MILQLGKRSCNNERDERQREVRIEAVLLEITEREREIERETPVVEKMV